MTYLEAMEVEREEEDQEEESRNTYLKVEDLEKYGYTDGCEGCRRLKSGGMTRRAHTSECRERIESQLEKTEHPRWQRAKERK